jgi:hypothetical protein
MLTGMVEIVNCCGSTLLHSHTRLAARVGHPGKVIMNGEGQSAGVGEIQPRLEEGPTLCRERKQKTPPYRTPLNLGYSQALQ